MTSVDSTQPDLAATRAQPHAAATRPRAAVTQPQPSVSRSGPGRGTEVGRYLVVDALGAGAMGEVFSAYDPELDRKVALKLVKFGSHEDVDKARIRLLREAQALAKLSHPNVVAVHDAGTLGDRVFIAMEYVDGQTFRRWLNDRQERDPNATWREALALLLQAGRGLAAAHEAGLVHRDFKPANVMVSSDGRVRVLDFGLARRFGETDAEAPPPPAVSANDLTVSLSGTRSSLALQLTQTGMVMGTPAYMAPEQFFGGEIDARTDQFSFCVVLYRALLGVRPFLGDDYDQLARAVGSHELRETPRTSTVPRAIVAVLRQGLAASPERRFRSMDALLDALTRATSRGRRRLMFAAGTAAALAGAAGLFLSDRAPAAFTPCLGAEAKLTGVWDEATRQHVADAFETTALPFAADARAETTRSLDRWAEQWVESHAQTCEATRVRGDQSEALMDLRIGCLDRRLQDLAAVTDVLVHADAQVVENAAQGVQQLAPPSECVGVERDDDGLLIPHDPELVGQVEQVRNRLAAGRAYLLAGKFEQAREEAAAGLERARALGYQPTIAEAAFALAHVHERLMVLDPALALYEEALFAAAASNHARIEARSLIGMLSLLGMHKGETEAALRYGRHAEAVNQRLGNPAELAATLALYRGNARSQANELVDAITDMEQAVLLSADNPRLERIHLAALNNVAALKGKQGHYREAVEALEAALATAVPRVGTWHPAVGSYHNNLGATFSYLGDYDRALEHQTRAIEILEKVLGADNPELGRSYHNLGVVLSSTGDHRGALDNYRHALELKTNGLGANHPSVAVTANNVGDALLALDRAQEAIPHFEDALRIFTAAWGPDNTNNVVALVSLGEARLKLEQPTKAVPHLRRALSLIESGQLDPVSAAQARFVAAQAISKTGGQSEALALARQARDGYVSSERPSKRELDDIDQWLAQHGEP